MVLGRSLNVVDFGSGSGNSSLVLASLFPSCNFTLVDSKPSCISILKTRIATSGLTNVTPFLGDVMDYKNPFDVGIAIHLCGEATDLAMKSCIANRASFVLVPCCVGKIHKVVQSQIDANVETPDYPRSSWLKSKLPMTDYLSLTRVADFSDGGGEGSHSEVAEKSKVLIDMDRARRGEEEGYKMQVGKLEPRTCSVKNDIIVGQAPLAPETK